MQLVDTCQQLTKIEFDSFTLGNIEVRISCKVRNFGYIFDCVVSMVSHVDNLRILAFL